MGATTGAYPDLEAARAVIQMLTGLVNIPVDLKELDTEIEDMRKKMEPTLSQDTNSTDMERKTPT